MVSLLAKLLTGAHERPRWVWGTTLLIQADQPLVTLVGREVRSWGFSWKQSHWALVWLVEGWSWWAKAHVALPAQLLLVVVVVLVDIVAAVHQRARAPVIEHVLPWKPC